MKGLLIMSPVSVKIVKRWKKFWSTFQKMMFYKLLPFPAITSLYHQPESLTVRCKVG